MAGCDRAMVLQDYYPEKLNMEKVMFLLLIHDLGEIYAGDTWVFDDKKKLHAHDRELASIEKNNEPPSRSNICEYEKFVVGV